MRNEEQIIEGLIHCRKHGSLSGQNCSGYYEYSDNLDDIIKANDYRKDCPYGKCRTGCVVTLIDDTLKLLEEQKEEIENLKQTAQSMMEGIVMSNQKFYPCSSCQEFNCDFCPYKEIRRLVKNERLQL